MACTSAQSTEAECYSSFVQAQKIMEECLQENYSKFVFPKIGGNLNALMNNVTITDFDSYSSYLDITVTLYVVTIFKLLDLTNSKKLSVALQMIISWVDPNVNCFTDSQAVVTAIPTGWLWTPKLILLNPATSNNSIPLDALVSVQPMATGSGSMISAIATTTVDSVCTTMNFVDFPFDSQSCVIRIVDRTYFVDFQLRTTDFPTAYIEAGASSSEWKLQKVSAFLTNSTDLYGLTKSVIAIMLTQQRSSYYYFLNLIVPTLVIVSLNVLVFLLPSDQGTKAKLCSTNLLTVFVLLQSVYRLIPQLEASQVPRIVLALQATLLATTVSLAEAIVLQTLQLMAPGFPKAVNSFVVDQLVRRWNKHAHPVGQTQAVCQVFNVESRCEQLMQSQSQIDQEEKSILFELLNIELNRVKAEAATKQKLLEKKLVRIAWKRLEHCINLLCTIVYVVLVIYYFAYYIYI